MLRHPSQHTDGLGMLLNSLLLFLVFHLQQHALVLQMKYG